MICATCLSRNTWVGLLQVGVALTFYCSIATASDDSRPNFVVFLCDDLGWGDLSCFGHPHIRTPNLDQLANAGVRLTSCYSPAPVCSPSRVGLLTGRSPNRAGVFDWIPAATEPAPTQKAARSLVHLRRTETTLPGLLQQAGYATAMAGKWHCNAIFNDPQQPQPDAAGFDHWFATQNNAAPSHENPDNYVRNGQPVGQLEGFSCQIVADEAIAWLQRHQQRHASQPFFLYLPFHEPHEPVASPDRLVESYRDVAANEDQAQYFANVENMDHAIGRVLAALEDQGQSENTVVFFTSDNGPETLNRYRGARRSYGSPGPLRGMKLWTTEAGSRVAGILRWSGKIRPGTENDQPVSSLDLLPTLASLAKVPIPAGLDLDGCDIAGLWEDAPIVRSKPLFWVYFNAINEQRVAMRDGPWKLLAKIETVEGKTMAKMENITTSRLPAVQAGKLTDFSLYRLSEDIREANDVSKSQPEELERLAARLRNLYAELVQSMHVWPDQP